MISQCNVVTLPMILQRNLHQSENHKQIHEALRRTSLRKYLKWTGTNAVHLLFGQMNAIFPEYKSLCFILIANLNCI